MDFLRKAETCVDFENMELRLMETVKLDREPRAGECCEVRGTAARVPLTVLSGTDGGGSKSIPVSVAITDRVSHR